MSLNISSLNKSPKNQGKYEKKLINILSDYFISKNYNVRTHISFNLAWGRIISEIDLLALKDDEITIIEVKSKSDKISHAKKQYSNIKEYIDYYFVASEINIENNFFNDKIGIIRIKDNKIEVIKKGIKIDTMISVDSIIKLKKKDIIKISDDIEKYKYESKEYIAKKLLGIMDQKTLKKKIQKILLVN